MTPQPVRPKEAPALKNGIQTIKHVDIWGLTWFNYEQHLHI
jgi:hypothetical protein